MGSNKGNLLSNTNSKINQNIDQANSCDSSSTCSDNSSNKGTIIHSNNSQISQRIISKECMFIGFYLFKSCFQCGYNKWT